MADTLANLEAVINKWSDRGPYSAGDGPRNPVAQKNLQDYNKVIERGKGWWKEKFTSVGPPPVRSEKYGRQRRPRTDIPRYTQGSCSSISLASFKVMPVVVPADERSRRPYMGRCCACMPTSKLEHLQEGVESAPLRDILRVPTRSRRNGWWTRTFYHVSYVMQRDVSHQYSDVSLAVLTAPRVIEAIQKSALQELGVDQVEDADQKKLKKEVKKQRRRTKSVVHQMQATISNALIRLTGWFLHKLLGRLFSSVLVHTGQMKVLTNVCKRDLPVIFLPTHQSHMDYILLTFLLFNYDLRAPHVAAGDNLRIPFFGMLMRSLGGYFIRRKLDGKPGSKKDFIYRSVLHTYMQELLAQGQFFEFFIEGGRTRTGKALYPKGGLLSVIVDCYLDGTIPDAYLAPVSISYEKLLDGNFTTELQGLPKHQETFWRACSAIWSVIWGKFGNVRVDFGQPFSLKEYLAVCQTQLVAPREDDPLAMSPISRSNGSSLSLYSELAAGDHRVTVQTLAQHVVHSCTSLRAMMSTHIVAFLLLTKHRQGVSLSRLAQDVESLVEELQGRGRDVGFSGEATDVILYACDLLGDHIVKVEAKNNAQEITRVQGDQNNNPSVLFVRPVMCMYRTLELSYYANAVITDFALESVLALCILAELEALHWPAMWTTEDKPSVKKSDLVIAATHLIHLLHVEFIMRAPCSSIDMVIDEAIERLLAWDVLSVDEEAETMERKMANRLSRSLEWGGSSDEDEEGEENFCVSDTVYKIETSRHSLNRLRFLHSVLAPLLETYYIVMIESTKLATTPRTEKDFVSNTHQLLTERINTKVACYVESANQVTVKTAVQALRQLRLVEIKDSAEGSELTVGNDSKEHVERLLDLLANFTANPLGLPCIGLPVSA